MPANGSKITTITPRDQLDNMMTDDSNEPPVVTEGEWLCVPVRHEDETEFSPNLILTIARAFGVSVDELPPIAESIDPDILDTLFAKQNDGGRHVEALQFQYEDRMVRIDSKSDSHFTILRVEDIPPAEANSSIDS